MKDINEKLAEILEVDTVNDSDVFTQFDEWDSLTSLSIIAMVDANYNTNISAEQLLSFTTVGDLKNYLNSKKS